MSVRLALHLPCDIKDGIELLTLLPLGCWDHGHITVLDFCCAGARTQSSVHARQALYFYLVCKNAGRLSYSKRGWGGIQIYSPLCYNTTRVLKSHPLMGDCDKDLCLSGRGYGHSSQTHQRLILKRDKLLIKRVACLTHVKMVKQKQSQTPQ